LYAAAARAETAAVRNLQHAAAGHSAGDGGREAAGEAARQVWLAMSAPFTGNPASRMMLGRPRPPVS
jgi:hypothetical protein